MCTGTQQYKVVMLMERITKSLRLDFDFRPGHGKDYVVAYDLVRNNEVSTAIWKRQLQALLMALGRRAHVSEEMLATWLIDGVFKGTIKEQDVQAISEMPALFESYGIKQSPAGRVSSTSSYKVDVPRVGIRPSAIGSVAARFLGKDAYVVEQAICNEETLFSAIINDTGTRHGREIFLTVRSRDALRSVEEAVAMVDHFILEKYDLRSDVVRYLPTNQFFE